MDTSVFTQQQTSVALEAQRLLSLPPPQSSQKKIVEVIEQCHQIETAAVVASSGLQPAIAMFFSQLKADLIRRLTITSSPGDDADHREEEENARILFQHTSPRRRSGDSHHRHHGAAAATTDLLLLSPFLLTASGDCSGSGGSRVSEITVVAESDETATTTATGICGGDDVPLPPPSLLLQPSPDSSLSSEWVRSSGDSSTTCIWSTIIKDEHGIRKPEFKFQYQVSVTNMTLVIADDDVDDDEAADDGRKVFVFDTDDRVMADILERMCLNSATEIDEKDFFNAKAIGIMTVVASEIKRIDFHPQIMSNHRLQTDVVKRGIASILPPRRSDEMVVHHHYLNIDVANSTHWKRMIFVLVHAGFVVAVTPPSSPQPSAIKFVYNQEPPTLEEQARSIVLAFGLAGMRLMNYRLDPTIILEQKDGAGGAIEIVIPSDELSKLESISRIAGAARRGIYTSGSVVNSDDSEDMMWIETINLVSTMTTSSGSRVVTTPFDDDVDDSGSGDKSQSIKFHFVIAPPAPIETIKTEISHLFSNVIVSKEFMLMSTTKRQQSPITAYGVMVVIPSTGILTVHPTRPFLAFCAGLLAAAHAEETHVVMSVGDDKDVVVTSIAERVWKVMCASLESVLNSAIDTAVVDTAARDDLQQQFVPTVYDHVAQHLNSIQFERNVLQKTIKVEEDPDFYVKLYIQNMWKLITTTTKEGDEKVVSCAFVPLSSSPLTVAKIFYGV